jgi:hypothetical protein
MSRFSRACMALEKTGASRRNRIELDQLRHKFTAAASVDGPSVTLGLAARAGSSFKLSASGGEAYRNAQVVNTVGIGRR